MIIDHQLASPTGSSSGGARVDSGLVAHVSFRVHCAGLGHGEEVFLIRGDDMIRHKPIPLHTTATAFPWYQTLAPVVLSLPPAVFKTHDSTNLPPESKYFWYRYAIYRGGVFYRWERPSDAPADPGLLRRPSGGHRGGGVMPAASGATPDASGVPIADLSMDDSSTHVHTTSTSDKLLHELSLLRLTDRESYLVHDVLGVTTGQTDLEHLRPPSQPTYARASSLHSRDNSGSGSVFSNAMHPSGSAGSAASLGKSPVPQSRKVGFAPAAPHFHYNTVNNNPKALTTKQAVHLNSTDGLVVVSVFLPVILHRSPQGVWSADWDYEMLLSMQTHLRVTRIGVVKWRGWHGNKGMAGSPEGGVPENERGLVEDCLRPFNCVPVWVDPNTFGEMYNGFCKQVLWPLFHNVTSVYSSLPSEVKIDETIHPMSSDSTQFSEYCRDDIEQGPIHGGTGREAELWSAYNNVNRLFAEVVVQCFNEGDLVWVHGFHLLILPSYLTRRLPLAKVGIFLHTPFPSSEIFRTLWCREDLLRGMLNADQIGFHLYEYARHFLTSCRRLLGLNYGMIPDATGGHNLAIDINGRHVAVTCIHAGIEPPVLNQILSHRGTVEEAASIRNQFQGKTIFCAIDRLESLKGIPLKLLGLERFLRRCPEWYGKFVVIQVGISAFERGDDYFVTKKEVTELVNKINQVWPGTVQFRECSEPEMRLQQRMVLLRAADVALVTPIRDGLNLTPLEFTIAHQDALSENGRKDGRKRGLCILSEFSSCTRVMRGALHINPWKISETAIAFYQALNMSDDERMRRISCASEFVTRVTTQRWALAVMLDLKGVHKNVSQMQFSGAGLGLGYRLVGMDMGFTSLDIGTVAKAYKNSWTRLILIDYGGTIVSNDNLNNLTRFQMVKERSAPSTPTKQMITALTELCADKRNTVFVVSGKERHSLTKSLGNVPNLGMAAEHGMFISWPTAKTTTKRRWETLVPDTDRAWRSLAVTIMEVYTSRTHGSYIEETEMKVLWQYRDADPEFGYQQARELEDHLAKYLRSFAVDILHGGMEEGGYVEVRPKGVNKGVLAMHVIKHFPTLSLKDKIDFALVLGDDHCDEPMLSVMRQIGRRVIGARRARKGEDPLPPVPATITLVDVSSCDNYVSADLEMFTCTVGKKPSAAANYLHDVNEVQELFDSLVKVSTRDHRFHSSADLRSHQNNEKMENISLSERFSSGLVKSMSWDKEQPGADSINNNESPEVRVSSSLKDYLGLGTIEDDDDEEAFFF